MDADGNIIFENSAALKMFDREEKEMLGQHAHSIIHHHHADGTGYLVEECPIYLTLHDGKVRRVDNEVYFRKDGSSFPIEYICSPTIESTGKISGVVVVFRDIT